MVENQNIDELWSQQNIIIREYLADQPRYEQLSSEVAYTLRRRLNEANIEHSVVSHRTKTLNSFLEKILRKRSEIPMSKIMEDLAGVRIVYLYKNDLDKISKIIDDEFKILEKVDKASEQDPDRFGYGAVHYIVQLGRKSSGVRYDDLKEFSCEIQVRTVLQDAWAIVSHHLVYKREADIPNPLKRKLNSLSGLFSTADDQFDSIRIEREQYIAELEKSSVVEDGLLTQEINVDTVAAFLKKRFPKRELEKQPGDISYILSTLNMKRYSSLGDLSNVLRRTEKAIAVFSQIIDVPFSAPSILSLSISIADKEYRRERKWLDHVLNAISQVEHLLED